MVRDYEGTWVVVRSRSLGCATNYMVKLCALRGGLALIRDRGLLPVIIKANSLFIISVLKDFDKPMSSFISSLIKDCMFLFQLLGNLTIKHIYREANVVIDFVAKNAIHSSNYLNIFFGYLSLRFVYIVNV